MHPHNKLDLVPRPEGASAASAVAAAVGLGSAVPITSPHHPALVPEAQVRPWGSPMYEPAPIRRTRERPDTESAWGRGQKLLPDQTVPEFARVELEVSEPLTVSVDVLVPPGLIHDTTTPLTIWALVTFGNGSTTATRKIRCDYRFDVTLVASFISVQAYVGLLDGTPALSPWNSDPDFQPPAQVAVQVARGIRGLPYVCTQFLTANDTTGVLVNGPARALSVEAHLAAVAGAPQFLQLFDLSSAGAIPGGTPPDVEYPLGTTPYPGVILTRWLNPRGFSQGIRYGVSSTSGTYTPSGEIIHIELEQLLL